MVHNSISIPFGFEVGSAGSLSPKSTAYMENIFRSIVREEVDAQLKAHSLVYVETGKKVGGGGGESGGTYENLRLRFTNKISSTVFTANDIEAENGEELRVELYDVVNDHIIDATHPLSSAWIDVVVCQGEFDNEEAITQSDFKKSIVLQRLGERSLLVGDDKRFRLNNGVYSITNLSFTRNSSRSRTKKIRLGLRIDDSNNNYPTIQHAVSNPFRVKDHRGQLNKKHHPPSGEDHVWRLEGIARNGEYHRRLTSHGILNVDGFVKAFKMDSRSLREWLGNRVSDKKWKMMVKQALQYVPITIPTFDPPNYEFQDQTVLGNFQDVFYNPIFEGLL